jgi:Holliday junction resolvase RusA-like endonuclease
MEAVSFIVPIMPASMQGAGKRAMSMGGRVVFFKEKRAKDYETAIKFYASPHIPKEKFTGPVKLTIAFVLKRPASLNGKKFPQERIPATKRPDLDNLVKFSVQDCLSAFWEDDSLVTQLIASKWYAAVNEQPKIEIAIESIEGIK